MTFGTLSGQALTPFYKKNNFSCMSIKHKLEIFDKLFLPVLALDRKYGD